MFNGTEKLILCQLFNKLMSRIDIAHRLNITGAAVTQYTNVLLEKKAIQEKGEELTNIVGRNKKLLGINENFGYVVGIAFEIDFIECAIANCKGQHISYYKQYITLEKMEDYYKKKLDIIFKKLLQDASIFPSQILGVGITYPGFKDSFTKATDELKKFECMADFTEEYFKHANNYIVKKGNNVHSLAMAEYMLNEFDDNFFCIKYGPRIGSALWLNGKIFKGSHNAAGEISHMTLPIKESEYPCEICGKKSCLESQISDKFLRKSIMSIPDYQEEFPYLFDSYSDVNSLQSHMIFHHFSKDKRIEKIMNNVCYNIALAVATIEGIIDSKRIILFGESFLIDAFFNQVCNYIKEFCLLTEGIDIVLAKTQPKHKVTGAFFLILTELMFI